MQKFDLITSIIAPLPLDNVDTDMIIPKQFLKTIKRTGLGKNLFHEMRYDLDGKLIENFVLNQEKYQHSKILISGENCGCGSSREHAPWALNDFGIRVIIAPSFADIFYNNCFKNSILPIKLEQESMAKIWAQITQQDDIVSINLAEQKIIFSDNTTINFTLDQFRKKCLLEGLDDIDLTMESAQQIEQFEQQQKITQPWLYN